MGSHILSLKNFRHAKHFKFIKMVYTFTTQFEPFNTVFGSEDFQNTACKIVEQIFETNKNCQRSSTKERSRNKNTTVIRIPLHKFTADQVQVNMGTKGLMTVTASRESTEDTKRNGQRKSTVVVEETVQMPGYVMEHRLMDKIDSNFEHGFLIVNIPQDPKLEEERKKKQTEVATKTGPIEIPIMMEE